MICHYLRLCRVLKLLFLIFLIMPEIKFCKSSPLYKDQSFKDDAEVDVLIDAAILNKNFNSLSFFEKLVKSSINNHFFGGANTACIDLRMHSYVLDADGIDIPPPDLVSFSSFSSLPTPSSSSSPPSLSSSKTTKSGGATTHSSVLIDGQIRGKAHLYPLLETIRDAGLRGYQFSIVPASNGTRGCFERMGRTSKAIPRIIHQSWKVWF